MKIQCAFCPERLPKTGDLFVHVKNNHPTEWQKWRNREALGCCTGSHHFTWHSATDDFPSNDLRCDCALYTLGNVPQGDK